MSTVKINEVLLVDKLTGETIWEGRTFYDKGFNFRQGSLKGIQIRLSEHARSKQIDHEES